MNVHSSVSKMFTKRISVAKQQQPLNKSISIYTSNYLTHAASKSMEGRP